MQNHAGARLHGHNENTDRKAASACTGECPNPSSKKHSGTIYGEFVTTKHNILPRPNDKGEFSDSLTGVHRARKRRCAARLLSLSIGMAFLITGCASSDTSSVSGYEDIASSMKGSRDSVPVVLTPTVLREGEDGAILEGTEDVTLDLSHTAEGYCAASYTGSSEKVKLQITTPDAVTYTYTLPADGSDVIYSFADGTGTYRIGVYTNVESTLYATEYVTEVEVILADEFLPFLYPNQYVWFTDETQAVAAAADIASPADTDLDVVNLVYNYIVENVAYDWDKAETVASGYLPDVDETLETGKGICLDYASLMAAMLRSQRIPTRMEVGYAGTAYHAWISTYVDDIGWVNGIIEFDGTDWSLMDPTLDASQGAESLTKFITDETQYVTYYLY